MSPELAAEALFVSNLQRSQPLSDQPGFVQAYVHCALIQHDEAAIAGMLAQEFGDHPEAAAERMGWCRSAVAEAFQSVGAR